MRQKKPSPEFLSQIAKNLKTIRRLRKMTQMDLVRSTGLAKNYISAVECGKINMCLSNVETIANGLGCEIWEIVTRRN